MNPVSPGPFPRGIAEKVTLKCHLETPIPGVKGNRKLDREKIEKCVLFSSDLRSLIEANKLYPGLRIFEKPVGFTVGNRGVLFRETPHANIIPGFSFWARRKSGDPILVQFLTGVSKSSVCEAFVTLVVSPLIRGLLSAMAFGYGLEMHAQNTCFRIVGSDKPVEVYYRDLEGVAYSGKLRERRGETDPFSRSGNSEVYKYDTLIHRFFNRNYDLDLGTVISCCLNALRYANIIQESGSRWIRQQAKRMYREAYKHYRLSRWDRYRGMARWSRSPYGTGYRRSHYYRRYYR
jgi:hypothetical protein